MKQASTKSNFSKKSKGRIVITPAIQRLWEQRDKSLDHGDAPQLPPEIWANATIGKYYRPIKTQISFRIDNDILDWLKSKGEGHLSRINAILREYMQHERRA